MVLTHLLYSIRDSLGRVAPALTTLSRTEYQTSVLYLSYSEAKLTRTSRPFEDGDIVNIDITVYLDGYHGDTSQTFLVGTVVRTHPLFVGGYKQVGAYRTSRDTTWFQ